MSYEKLVSMNNETVPQDLDQMERDVLLMIEQQARDAANQQDVATEAPAAAQSKFARRRPTPQQRRPEQPLPFFSLFMGKDKSQKQAAHSRFLLPVNANAQPCDSAQKPAEKKTAVTRRANGSVSTTALQAELGQIRHAKVHQYESVARLLHGLAQGNDVAENIAATRHPELLKKFSPSH